MIFDGDIKLIPPRISDKKIVVIPHLSDLPTDRLASGRLDAESHEFLM